MTIHEYQPNQTLDLSLEEGNVFSLIGMSSRLSKQLGKDGKAISHEMMASDYGNAVYVFNREFGDFFDIILPKCLSMKDVKSSYLQTNATPAALQETYLK